MELFNVTLFPDGRTDCEAVFPEDCILIVHWLRSVVLQLNAGTRFPGGRQLLDDVKLFTAEEETTVTRAVAVFVLPIESLQVTV